MKLKANITTPGRKADRWGVTDPLSDYQAIGAAICGRFGRSYVFPEKNHCQLLLETNSGVIIDVHCVRLADLSREAGPCSTLSP